MVMVITFDDFYNADDYNKFIEAAKFNKVKFSEYVLAQPPYYHCIEIDDKNAPSFLKYTNLKTQRYFAMCSKIVPRYPEEVSMLKRRTSDGNQAISKFIENDVLREARNQKFVCAFKFTAKKILDYSIGFPDKLFILGMKNGYKIGVCFNSYIQNVVPQSDMFVVTSNDYVREVGMFEMLINNNWAPKFKLTHKTLVSAYCENGKIFQISRPIITFS